MRCYIVGLRAPAKRSILWAHNVTSSMASWLVHTLAERPSGACARFARNNGSWRVWSELWTTAPTWHLCVHSPFGMQLPAKSHSRHHFCSVWSSGVGKYCKVGTATAACGGPVGKKMVWVLPGFALKFFRQNAPWTIQKNGQSVHGGGGGFGLT